MTYTQLDGLKYTYQSVAWTRGFLPTGTIIFICFLPSIDKIKETRFISAMILIKDIRTNIVIIYRLYYAQCGTVGPYAQHYFGDTLPQDLPTLRQNLLPVQRYVLMFIKWWLESWKNDGCFTITWSLWDFSLDSSETVTWPAGNFQRQYTA